MSWKDDLLELKRQERWMDIIVFCEQQIQKDNNSADSYIQTIYLTHDILLEENPTPLEAQEAQRFLMGSSAIWIMRNIYFLLVL